jgi:hypothetical protein
LTTMLQGAYGAGIHSPVMFLRSSLPVSS